MDSKYVTLQEHLAQLVERHGSVRAAARVTGIDPSYLWRLLEGEKDGPRPDVLRKLGLKKQVTFYARRGKR